MDLNSEKNLTRGGAIKQLIVLPALAGLVGMSAIAADADTNNKAQFKYQDKPGAGGHKCSQCQLFKAPHSCAVVHGTISPNGWCTAWVKKS